MGDGSNGNAEQLTWWWADSPAKTSQSPDGEAASTPSALACGGRCCGSCERCDPVGFSLRTYLLSALGEQTPCSLVWRRRATPAGRPWWVLGRSGLRTGGNGSGSLPKGSPRATPNQRDWKDSGATQGYRHSPNLGTQAHQAKKEWAWPTPQAFDATDIQRSREARNRALRKGGCRNLREEVHLVSAWPTPTVSDCHGGGSRNTPSSKAHYGVSLMDVLNQDGGTGRLAPTHPNMSGKPRGSLNPRWVAQLMGLPAGWLDLPPGDDESS